MSHRLAQLLELMKTDPDSPFLLFAVAKEYEGIGETDKALDCYGSLVESYPDYTGTYYHYAALLMKNERHNEGFLIYDRGIETCRRLNDTHALAELQNARLNWDLEL